MANKKEKELVKWKEFTTPMKINFIMGCIVIFVAGFITAMVINDVWGL